MTVRFLGAGESLASARVVLRGVPMDLTTSFRSGTGDAPQAIRTSSWALETYSPALDASLREELFCDQGDLDLEGADVPRALGAVEEWALQACRAGKKPLAVGGEHLLSLGMVRALYRCYPDLLVLHLDAHADLREQYAGRRYSHATVMRRIWEVVGDGGLLQGGIRSGTREEFRMARSRGLLVEGELYRAATRAAEAGRPVYLTLDIDVLDPATAPGTGCPEPGGPDARALFEALYGLRRCLLVGADVVEVCPKVDPSGATTILAAKIIREVAIMMGAEGESSA